MELVWLLGYFWLTVLVISVVLRTIFSIAEFTWRNAFVLVLLAWVLLLW